MKSLVSYLTEHIGVILVLIIVLIGAAAFWVQKNMFTQHGSTDSSPDIEPGSYILDATDSQAADYQFSNVVAEWAWPDDDCEQSPELKVQFDLVNSSNEPQPALTALVFPFAQGGLGPPIQVETPVPFNWKPQVFLFEAYEGEEISKKEPRDMISPGEDIHYEGVVHPDFIWDPSGLENNAAPNQAFPTSLSDVYLLILGLPEIAGNFRDEAEGETGGSQDSEPGFHLTDSYAVQVGWYEEQATPITGDTLAAGFQNFSIFYVEYLGSYGYILLPGAIDPAPAELPNLTFTIPEVEDQILLDDDTSWAVFVFPGGAPAAWDGISQFEASDFAFIEAVNSSIYDTELVSLELKGHYLQLCTPTATVSQATSTPTAGGDATATPRPTLVPSRTPKPTDRNTPRPPQNPK